MCQKKADYSKLHLTAHLGVWTSAGHLMYGGPTVRLHVGYIPVDL